jgi:hypothetical protein
MAGCDQRFHERRAALEPCVAAAAGALKLRQRGIASHTGKHAARDRRDALHGAASRSHVAA